MTLTQVFYFVILYISSWNKLTYTRPILFLIERCFVKNLELSEILTAIPTYTDHISCETIGSCSSQTTQCSVVAC